MSTGGPARSKAVRAEGCAAVADRTAAAQRGRRRAAHARRARFLPRYAAIGAAGFFIRDPTAH